MDKSFLKNAVKYGLGLGLLGLVVWLKRDDLARTFSRPIDPLAFAGAFAVCAASLLLTVVRWFVLVRAQGLPFAPADALRLGLVGYFSNTFLPGSVGGDLVKATFLAREQSRRSVAVATVVIDRAVGLVGVFWLVMLVGGAAWLAGAGVVLANAALRTIIAGATAVALGSLAGWALLGLLPEWRAERFAGRLARLPKLGGPLAEMWRSVWLYRRRSAAMAAGLALSVLSHCGFALVFFLAASALTFDRPIPGATEHLIAVPAGLVFQAFVPTPGGVGGGEAGFAALYGMMGADPADGVAASLTQRVVTLLLGMCGGVVFLSMRRPAPADARAPAEALPAA